MIVLGLDTCLSACSAAVIDGERVLARASEPMTRGHQERLAPLVAEVMGQAGLSFDRLERVGVTIGPGSFTGLRVGLAFAKGMAAALGVPLVGVGTLEALAQGRDGMVFAVIDARRDQVYLQAFSGSTALSAPDVLPVEIAAARLAELGGGGPITLVGSGAALLAAAAPRARLVSLEAADPVTVARLAAVRTPAPARPLYLRAPDARLPGA